VGGVSRGNEAKRNDLVERNPEERSDEAETDLLCAVLFALPNIT
jgi:hypothetical protein